MDLGCLRFIFFFSFTYRIDERLQKWNQVGNSTAKKGCSSLSHTSVNSSNYKWKINCLSHKRLNLNLIEFKIIRLYRVENIILGIIVSVQLYCKIFLLQPTEKNLYIFTVIRLIITGTKTFSSLL